MQGIDGKFALLKMAQTHLCVKWKNLTDKTLSEFQEFQANSGLFAQAYAPDYAFN